MCVAPFPSVRMWRSSSSRWMPIPARGVLLNRLTHYPHPLPLTAGELQAWLILPVGHERGARCPLVGRRRPAPQADLVAVALKAAVRADELMKGKDAAIADFRELTDIKIAAGTTGLSTNDDSAPWFPVEGQPTYYQSEMTWETTQATGAGLVTIQLACDEGDCGETDTNRLCNVRGHAPLVCRVTLNESFDNGAGGHGIVEAGLGTELGGYTVRMFANCFECVPGTVLGLGVVLEQKFEVYNHLFYGYSPPEGWTFLADGAPPAPPGE